MTMSYTKRLEEKLRSAIKNKEALLADPTQMENFEKAVRMCVEAYQKGGRLYIAGNGGSAADAQHLAAEFVSKLAKPRAPLPAEALTTDTSAVTAIGNDFGFEYVFSRPIEGKMRKGDIFMALTTSGNSANIIQALKTCKALGHPSILFSGRGGGPAKAFADVTIVAPGDDPNSVQEVHVVLYHTLAGCVESILFPNL